MSLNFKDEKGNIWTIIGSAQTTEEQVFNGFGSYKPEANSVIYTPTENILPTDSDFTIDFYFYTLQVDSGTTLFDCGGIVISQPAETPNIIQVNISDTIALISDPVDINTWYNISVSREQNTFRLHVNLISIDSAIQDTSIEYGQNIYLGNDSTVGVNNFQGYIDDFRVTNGVARITTNPADKINLQDGLGSWISVNGRAISNGYLEDKSEVLNTSTYSCWISTKANALSVTLTGQLEQIEAPLQDDIQIITEVLGISLFTPPSVNLQDSVQLVSEVNNIFNTDLVPTPISDGASVSSQVGSFDIIPEKYTYALDAISVDPWLNDILIYPPFAVYSSQTFKSTEPTNQVTIDISNVPENEDIYIFIHAWVNEYPGYIYINEPEDASYYFYHKSSQMFGASTSENSANNLHTMFLIELEVDREDTVTILFNKNVNYSLLYVSFEAPPYYRDTSSDYIIGDENRSFEWYTSQSWWEVGGLNFVFGASSHVATEETTIQLSDNFTLLTESTSENNNMIVGYRFIDSEYMPPVSVSFSPDGTITNEEFSWISMNVAVTDPGWS